jgi:exonuclease VII large subunit
MKLSKVACLLTLAIGFGGCEPAPKRVSVDLSQIVVGQKVSEQPIAGPRSSLKSLSLVGNVGGRSARLLEEREGVELWEEAKATLVENRARSLERLKSDLERKYIGESRAKAIEAERLNELADDFAWGSVLDQTEQLMERYAGRKTELNAELASRIGFPDEGQAVPRRAREEVFLEQRRARVAELRKEIAELDAQFKAELTIILADYEQERNERLLKLMDLDYAGDLEAIARAGKEADEAIRLVIGQVNSAIPQLQKRLETLNAVTLKGESAQSVEPNFETEQWQVGLRQQELQLYVNVFVKSRGYELVGDGRGEDVTVEFNKWLKKNAVIR